MKKISCLCKKETNSKVEDLLAELPKDNIIKIVVFLRTQNSEDFLKKRADLRKKLKEKSIYKGPLSVMSQPPADGTEFCMEIWTSEQKIRYKEHNGARYSVIDNKEIVTEAIFPKSNQLESACEEVLQKAEEILQMEEMDFSNVVRQWNYIEDIVGVKNKQQNYQVFNEARTKFYNKINFTHGYPSATGIGMEYDLVNIELIASPEKNKLVPIENERQTPAYNYSGEVLYGGRKTPKFSRGKLNEKELYISGTASILNQEVQHIGSIRKQTKESINNMNTVIKNAEKEITGKPYFRAYVKDTKNSDIVKEVISKELQTNNFIVVKGEICRDELLVEIEGYMP